MKNFWYNIYVIKNDEGNIKYYRKKRRKNYVKTK